MRIVKTPYGSIPVNDQVELYNNGRLISCIPSGMCLLKTSVGKLIPRYSTSGYPDSSYIAVHFYAGGELHSVFLESIMPLETPVGEFNAEKVTFYRNGSPERIFPVKDFSEAYSMGKDVEPVCVATPAGIIEARIAGLVFYKEGTLRRVCLCPGETVKISTPVGKISIKGEIGFWPDGELEFVTPASPLNVDTPVGTIPVFDGKSGVSGCSSGALSFSEDGKVGMVRTSLCGIKAISDRKLNFEFYPQQIESSEAEVQLSPLEVCFHPKAVAVKSAPGMNPVCLAISDFKFQFTEISSASDVLTEFCRAG
ncbi:hypothetical protein [Maridesulfovibrio bastinii]|uniref:hypothetical protein n=1 Tax=Maridesulfovibrio bastinii TaxID=47157 RepID=UPI00040DF7B3|nr:hypothetical protein [Maridesulfovibrio bastinii]